AAAGVTVAVCASLLLPWLADRWTSQAEGAVVGRPPHRDGARRAAATRARGRLARRPARARDRAREARALREPPLDRPDPRAGARRGRARPAALRARAAGEGDGGAARQQGGLVPPRRLLAERPPVRAPRAAGA